MKYISLASSPIVLLSILLWCCLTVAQDVNYQRLRRQIRGRDQEEDFHNEYSVSQGERPAQQLDRRRQDEEFNPDPVHSNTRYVTDSQGRDLNGPQSRQGSGPQQRPGENVQSGPGAGPSGPRDNGPPGLQGRTPPGLQGRTPPGLQGRAPPGQQGRAPPGHQANRSPGHPGGGPPGHEDRGSPGREDHRPPGQQFSRPPAQQSSGRPGHNGAVSSGQQPDERPGHQDRGPLGQGASGRPGQQSFGSPERQDHAPPGHQARPQGADNRPRPQNFDDNQKHAQQNANGGRPDEYDDYNRPSEPYYATNDRKPGHDLNSGGDSFSNVQSVGSISYAQPPRGGVNDELGGQRYDSGNRGRPSDSGSKNQGQRPSNQAHGGNGQRPSSQQYGDDGNGFHGEENNESGLTGSSRPISTINDYESGNRRQNAGGNRPNLNTSGNRGSQSSGQLGANPNRGQLEYASGGLPNPNHRNPNERESQTISYLDRVTSTTSRSSGSGSPRCRSDEFTCRNRQCVPKNARCDDINNCADGSDELDCQQNGNGFSTDNRVTTSSSGVLTTAVSTGTGCTLPEHPLGGIYELGGCTAPCHLEPGQKVPANSILTYKCHAGYALKGNTISFCHEDEWYQPPSCVRSCPPLNSTSVDIMCMYNGATVSCASAVSPGTKATLACKHSYKLPLTSDPAYRELTCLKEGVWDRTLFRCLPECGTAVSHGNTLIVNGFTAKLGVFPWHVGIYQRNAHGSFEQICAGSMISGELVISAAHCFYDESTSQITDASNYAVAAGKHYRNYDAHEKYAQKSAVKRIQVADRYYGASGNFAEDIAIVHLKTPFTLTTLVRPICMDWDNTFERDQLQRGQIGKAVGWGKTETGLPSNELQEINLPYIPYQECVSAVPEEFKGYITADKFCAGYLNGSSLCEGDSGGGLGFKYHGLWYLRGIVSVSPVTQNTCDNNYYTAFTNVGRFREWIRAVYIT